MPTTTCPVQTSVEVIGGKWKPCILYRLQTGTFRFGELKKQMPWISEKVLIRQLKELEQDGVVKRHDYGEVPPRVDYRLTDYGLSVLPLMQILADWGKTHLEQSNS